MLSITRCAALALSSVLTFAANGGEGMFIQSSNAVPVSEDAPSIRSAVIAFGDDAFDFSSVVPGDVWSMNLFEGLNLPGLVKDVDTRNQGVTVIGDLLSDDAASTVGTFVASVVGDAMTMAAWLDDGRVFEVRPAADGSLVVRELDSVAFPGCATGKEQEVNGPQDHEHAESYPGGAPRGSCSDDGSVLDVLVVYTPSARNASGGTNGINSLINSAIASSNNSYNNSNISTQLNLVHVAEVDYSENGFSSDLGRLRGTGDGFMDEVHALRNQYNADFVAMISAGSGSCGIGYLMTNLSTNFASSAFTVTRYSCAVGNLTFAHEIGHNMGCTHDRDNANGGLYSYSFGHRWIAANNGSQYRSVMSYSPGTRIPHFSNPDVDYRGTPTGIPEGQSSSANNAQSIMNVLTTVSRFRLGGTEPQVLDSPASQSADQGDTVFLAVNAVGGDLVYTWLRNDAPIFNGGRISGADTAVLQIFDAQPSDAGDYYVAIGNNCGNVFSATGTLTVSQSCQADLSGNGTLDFFDITEFISLYNAGDLSADLAAPFGTLNFFDVSAYIALYNTGCP